MFGWFRKHYWALRYAGRAWLSITKHNSRFTDKEMRTLYSKMQPRVLVDIDRQLRTMICDAESAHEQDILDVTPGSRLRRLVEKHGGGDWGRELIEAHEQVGRSALDPFNPRSDTKSDLARAIQKMLQDRERGRKKLTECMEADSWIPGTRKIDLTSESESGRRSAESEAGTEGPDVEKKKARGGTAP